MKPSNSSLPTAYASGLLAAGAISRREQAEVIAVLRRVVGGPD
jgi:hypothetical protein